LRPPSPCRLRLWREGTELHAEWVRRSHRGWAWSDGLGVGEDAFPELYRLTLTGPAGQYVGDSATTNVSFSAANLPAAPGELVEFKVATVGPMALSREATATIII
jgi:hypothetical protein